MLKVSIFSGQSYSRPYINVIPVMMKKVFCVYNKGYTLNIHSAIQRMFE